MRTKSPSRKAGQIGTDKSGSSSSAAADYKSKTSKKLSAAADKSPTPAPQAIIDLAKLLGKFAASEIILEEAFAKRALDGMPNSSDPRS